jgi:hypothetical protein
MRLRGLPPTCERLHLLRRVTAIDRYRLARDKRGSRTAQPDYRRGNFLRQADTAHWMRGVRADPARCLQNVIHVRFNATGTNGVHADVLLGKFQRHRFGHPQDRMLACRINRRVRETN